MKIKKLIATALIATILIPSVCFAEIQKDKVIHVGTSAAVGLFLAQNKPFNKWKPWQRVLLNVAVVGGGKELYDSRHSGHSADWGDIAADSVGAVGAEGLHYVFVRQKF